MSLTCRFEEGQEDVIRAAIMGFMMLTKDAEIDQLRKVASALTKMASYGDKIFA